MKNLTIDQAELLFQLFIAQNADKMVSDLFPSDEIRKQVKIGTLEIDRYDYGVWVNDLQNGIIPFRYSINDSFKTWDTSSGPWYSFDIMKYISLEDKV